MQRSIKNLIKLPARLTAVKGAEKRCRNSYISSPAITEE